MKARELKQILAAIPDDSEIALQPEKEIMEYKRLVDAGQKFLVEEDGILMSVPPHILNSPNVNLAFVGRQAYCLKVE